VVAVGENVRVETARGEKYTIHPVGNKTAVKRSGVLAHTWSGGLRRSRS